MINEVSWIGMNIELAKQQATGAGFLVIVDTGIMQKLNCDYHAGRITFKVKDQLVVSMVVG